MTPPLDLSLVADRARLLLMGEAPDADGLTSASPAAAAALLAVLGEEVHGGALADPGERVFSGALPDARPERAVLVRVPEPPGGRRVEPASPDGLVGLDLDVVAVVRSGRVGRADRVLARIQAAAFGCLAGAMLGAPGLIEPAREAFLVRTPGVPDTWDADHLFTTARYALAVTAAA